MRLHCVKIVYFEEVLALRLTAVPSAGLAQKGGTNLSDYTLLGVLIKNGVE